MSKVIIQNSQVNRCDEYNCWDEEEGVAIAILLYTPYTSRFKRVQAERSQEYFCWIRSKTYKISIPSTTSTRVRWDFAIKWNRTTRPKYTTNLTKSTYIQSCSCYVVYLVNSDGRQNGLEEEKNQNIIDVIKYKWASYFRSLWEFFEKYGVVEHDICVKFSCVKCRKLNIHLRKDEKI